MNRALLPLLALALLAACKPERAALGQALSGKPPVIAGTLAGTWVIADLNGGGAPPRVTMMFDPGDHGTSRVSGNSGCNRFSGSWQQTGATLKFGQIAGTMRACEGPGMDVEQRFLAALAAVTKVIYTEAGDAILAAPDGRRITLRRPPAP
jgi:heat shock protein HslJ